MFFGKRQPVDVYAAPMMAHTMPEGPMMYGAPGAPVADTAAYGAPVGYGAPAHFAGPEMPGYGVHAYAGPGMAETVHASHTEMGPIYGPHYEHEEFDVQIEPRPKRHVHVVRKGETVYKIAKRYGLDWRELAGYNHLGNPNLIYPGQKLEIPPRY